MTELFKLCSCSSVTAASTDQQEFRGDNIPFAKSVGLRTGYLLIYAVVNEVDRPLRLLLQRVSAQGVQLI